MRSGRFRFGSRASHHKGTKTRWITKDPFTFVRLVSPCPCGEELVYAIYGSGETAIESTYWAVPLGTASEIR
jgi:hypothetical protein